MAISEVQGLRKGPWTPEEDKLLLEYVTRYGDGRWSCVSKCAGLNRSGKSCRLRWVNYLRPGLKKGHLTPQEEGIIIELHALWGNKWATIARYLPGRTDNEIKNYWRTHFKKRKSSSSSCCDDQHSQEKRKIQCQTAGKDDQDHTSSGTRRDDDEEEGKKGTGSDCTSMDCVTNHDDKPMQLPITPLQDYNTCSWSDFIPLDSCLFAGLWDMDDQIQIGSSYKTANQNIANSAAGGGDAMAFMYSGGYIL